MAGWLSIAVIYLVTQANLICSKFVNIDFESKNTNRAKKNIAETRKSLATVLLALYVMHAWMSKSDKWQRKLIICVFSKAFPFVHFWLSALNVIIYRWMSVKLEKHKANQIPKRTFQSHWLHSAFLFEHCFCMISFDLHLQENQKSNILKNDSLVTILQKYIFSTEIGWKFALDILFEVKKIISF